MKPGPTWGLSGAHVTNSCAGRGSNHLAIASDARLGRPLLTSSTGSARLWLCAELSPSVVPRRCARGASARGSHWQPSGPQLRCLHDASTRTPPRYPVGAALVGSHVL